MGLGNVFNNYAQQGLSVVTSWILIMLIYFVPYALIVGQLGSTFKIKPVALVPGSRKPAVCDWRTMRRGLIGSCTSLI